MICDVEGVGRMNRQKKKAKMNRFRMKHKKAILKGQRPTIMQKIWGEEE